MNNGPKLWDEILGRLKYPPIGDNLVVSAVVAGGAVRDNILGVKPNDIDVFIQGPANVLCDRNSFVGYGFAIRWDAIDHSSHPEYQEWSQGKLLGLWSGKYTDSEGDTHKIQLIHRQEIYEGVGSLVNTFDSEINKVYYAGKGNVALIGFAQQDYERMTYTCSAQSPSPYVTYSRFKRFNARFPNMLTYVPREGEDQPDVVFDDLA